VDSAPIRNCSSFFFLSSLRTGNMSKFWPTKLISTPLHFAFCVDVGKERAQENVSTSLQGAPRVSELLVKTPFAMPNLTSMKFITPQI
jgi:hypothetical protein